MAETIQDRGFDVKRSQTMHPGYAGTAAKACAFVDEALAEVARLREKVEILEAEIRVMRKLPSAINAAMDAAITTSQRAEK